MTPQREQALERRGDRQGLVRELALAAEVSAGVIRGLAKVGAVEAVGVSGDDPLPVTDATNRPSQLEDAQQGDTRNIIRNVGARRVAPQRAQARERCGDRQGLVLELALAADVSDGVIRGLVKAGAVEAVEVSVDDPFPVPDPNHRPPLLEAAQQEAARQFIDAVDAREFAPFLLDGVTGSGKTEVYFEAVAEAVREGRQTLVLLPEVALTEPFLKRFAARFGCEPVAWHAGLRQSQRRRA